MNDLERIREALLKGEVNEGAWVNDVSLAVADLDAHLKEGAASEANKDSLLTTIEEQRDELARLKKIAEVNGRKLLEVADERDRLREKYELLLTENERHATDSARLRGQYEEAVEEYHKTAEERDTERQRHADILRAIRVDCETKLAEWKSLWEKSSNAVIGLQAELARLRKIAEEKEASDKDYMNEIVRLREAAYQHTASCDDADELRNALEETT